jgi:hypothetical protein
VRLATIRSSRAFPRWYLRSYRLFLAQIAFLVGFYRKKLAIA